MIIERGRGLTVFQGARRPPLRLRGLCWLGTVGVLVTPVRGHAQTLEAWAPATRLTVRPHTLAIATWTERAGFQPLPIPSDQAATWPWDTTDKRRATQVYVPPQCVGRRRCPAIFWDNVMVSTLPNDPERDEMISMMADKHGFILVHNNMGFVNEAVTLLLQNFAVDPDRIAILSCGSGYAIPVAAKNLDIFSRVAWWSNGSVRQLGGVDPPNGKAEFFLMSALTEGGDGFLQMARELRRKGHRVKFALSARGPHLSFPDDIEMAIRWMLESWATPDPSARSVPTRVPKVLLTTEAAAKMTAFWTRFAEEPDSIRRVGRRAHQREVAVPVGELRLPALLMDVAAMARQYPSVAAVLRQAGLTATEHEAYRVALMSAFYLQHSPNWALSLDPASVQGRNLDFVEAHPDEFRAIAAKDFSNNRPLKNPIWMNP